MFREDTILIVHGNSVAFLGQRGIDLIKSEFPNAVVMLREDDEVERTVSEIKETAGLVLSDESGDKPVSSYVIQYRLIKVQYPTLT